MKKVLPFLTILIILTFMSCGYKKLNNDAPNAPTEPHPENNATNVPIDVTLRWSASDPDRDPLEYVVYFGTSSNPPRVASGLSSARYTPGTLDYSTTYYWKVVAKDDHGHSTEGPVWKFSTARNSPPNVPTNPSPANNATNVPIDVTLSWSASDPDGDPLEYDVYFGTSSNPPRVAQNLTVSNYTPGTLDYSKTYYLEDSCEG